MPCISGRFRLARLRKPLAEFAAFANAYLALQHQIILYVRTSSYIFSALKKSKRRGWSTLTGNKRPFPL